MSIETKFVQFIETNQEFTKAVEIVRKNAEGNIWLIGGYVYRGLAHCFYGTELPEVDLDFIVEKPHEKICLPSGWRQVTNRYGNPKLLGNFQIDFVPLTNVNSIKRRELEPTIDNYLTGTPLTVQSVVYDVNLGEIRGDVGIHVFMSKRIGINNRKQATIYAKGKGKPIGEIIREKAASLGYSHVLD